jgi:hypothetical protein
MLNRENNHLVKSSDILSKNQGGGILVLNVVIIFIFSLVLVAVLGYATTQLKVVRQSVQREQAFQIAEAGANYYQWHLSHFGEDFWDGNASTTPGPYVHDYIDKDTNQKIGEFSLQISPPPVGSTIVTIRSTGYTLANPKNKRTVTVRYGVPSLAKFAFLTHNDVWIGDSETVNGEMHANGGIRFDGTGNAPITSAKTTYNCPSWSGSPCPTNKPGIWGSASAQTQAYWDYPVPNIDFSSMTSDLQQIKSKAQSGGIYLPSITQPGYSLVFQNNGKVRIYRVNNLSSHSTGTDTNGVQHTEDINYNSRTELTVCNPHPCDIPANGLIFVEDDVWVEGVVSGKVTVAAGKFPYNFNSAPSIMIPNNLTYVAKDGNHVLGLISQKHILATQNSPNYLEIDAAMVAQNGGVQRYNFSGSIKNTITVYGSLASYAPWTWTWVQGGTVVSGYQNTVTTYDSNLLYGPPPSFPLTTDGYQQISWGSD